MTDQAEKFRRLFDLNYRLLLAYAVRRTHTRADAEDVVSAAFVVAWRRIDSIPADPHEQKLWLFGVAHKTLANQRRGAHRAARLSAAVQHEVRPSPPTDETVDDASDVHTALAALDRLGEADRQLITLAWVGRTEPPRHRQGDQTPVANVSVRLHRAKRRLRSHFDDLVQDRPESGHVHSRRATGDQEQESTE